MEQLKTPTGREGQEQMCTRPSWDVDQYALTATKCRKGDTYQDN